MLDKKSLIAIGSIILFCFIMFYLAEHESKAVKKYKKEMMKNKFNGIPQREKVNKNLFIMPGTYSSYEIVEKIKFKATPRQFEIFCALLFEELGYNVELTQYTQDGGKDLVLNNEIVVECKKYITDVVGREICQKLLGAMIQNNAVKAIVINTGRFNENAKEVARNVKQLKLINFYGIVRMLDKVGNEKANEILIKTFENRAME